MATKLFAMEELEETQVEGTEEMVAPEEGEAAEVGAEVVEDTAAIEDNVGSVEEGIGAADSMDEVQEVVEKSLDESEGEGEGLSEVAAEAIAVAVRAICARVGANPKSVYSLYATENFRSPSSRRANTKFALEGVGEFLKDLWEKIKAAILSLFEKVKAFWNKHISSLGRMVKALESMKAKISAAKGAPTFEHVEAPSSLKAIFPVAGGALGLREITDYETRITAANKSLEGIKVLEKAVETNLSEFDTVTAAKALETGMTGKGSTVEYGSESAPLPGGKYFKWTFKQEIVNTVGQGTAKSVDVVKLDVDEDHGEFSDGEKEVMLDNVGKEQLKSLITDAISMAKEMVKYRDKADKRAKDISKKLNDISKIVSAGNHVVRSKPVAKLQNNNHSPVIVKNAMRNYSLVVSKIETLESKLNVARLTYLRGVIIFSATCLKHIKKA